MALSKIPSSAFETPVESFDDNKIVNDISTLALREASNQNRGFYSTNAQSIDVFQDATGIDTTTNARLEPSGAEYVRSYGASTGSTEQYDYINLGIPTTTLGSNLAEAEGFGYFNGNQSAYIDPYTSDDQTVENPVVRTLSNTGGESTSSIIYDYGENIPVKNSITLSRFPYGRIPTQMRLAYSTDNSSYTAVDFSSSTELQYFKNVANGSTTEYNFTGGDSSGNMNFQNYGDTGNYRQIFHKISIPSGTISARYWKLSAITISRTSQSLDIQAGFGAFSPEVDILGVNPTGNFTGTTITALSSISSMGAIITYQDHSGTNALNTDIVLQLSADGGSNYTTATLEALPDFSTGIKMAKVNDVSVTAGTSLKYKISFANQLHNSKEARIRGVSLQY
jgi:hypothetical protein